MKNQRLTILAVVSACLLALFGCAPSDSGGGGGSSNQASLQPSNQEEEAFNIARYVPYTSSLPTCNSENLNQIYFIGSVNEFRYCSSSGSYVSLNILNRIEKETVCSLSIPIQSDVSTGSEGIEGVYKVTEFTSGDKFSFLMLDNNNSRLLQSTNWSMVGSLANDEEWVLLTNDVVGSQNWGAFEVKKINSATFSITYTDSSNEFYNFPNPQQFTFLYSEHCSINYPSD